MSFDSVADNAAFARKYSFPFLLLSDVSREMGMAYGAADALDQGSARRVAYLIDPDGKIRHAWPKVDARAFADHVLAQL